MTEIMLLDSETIDQIAAGEVVERPSSVVKELAENAIDAGASAVTVELRHGGKELIRVTDNGCGIDASMIPRAFERHSTSKLHSIRDLQQIATLGFRGEALSSIAAVSRVELMTRTENAMTGMRYRIEGGTEKEIQPAGLPQGTTVIVKDLFYHTPARQKFLKSDQTETSYVAQLMETLALSHPEISFRYIADGKVRLETAGTGNLIDVIYRIYGSGAVKNLIETDLSDGTYRLKGYLGKPVLSRGNRRFESVFVNGRSVTDRILQKGIEDGYKRYLMQHQFPFAVLFFEVPGTLVDVNVHPAKAQVRFSEEKEVYDFVCSGVRDALHTDSLIRDIPLQQKADTQQTIAGPVFERPGPAIRETPEPYETQMAQQVRSQTSETTDAQQAFSESASSGQLCLPVDPVHRMRFVLIGQLFATYWLLEYDGKLYLIDQHAAHERVNYERFLRIFRAGNVSSQQLYPAVSVTLQAQEMELAEKYRDYIASYGFEIDHFGGNEYRICAVPMEMFGMNAKVFFLSFLDEINDLSAGTSDPDIITDRLATAACKASIKGHDVIPDREALLLLEELFSCDDPYHCPHGRPTMISFSRAQIEKLFGRTVP